MPLVRFAWLECPHYLILMLGKVGTLSSKDTPETRNNSKKIVSHTHSKIIK